MSAFIDAIEYYFATHEIFVPPIASGKCLDNLGKLFGFNRNTKESDDAYRERIAVVFDTGG